MIKVTRHGQRTSVTNPATLDVQFGRIVTYEEEGRGGANPLQEATNRALSNAVGRRIGLNQVRRHNQFVPDADLVDFPVNKVFANLYINRHLFSEAQIEQQREVKPRKILGKTTFFLTVIEETPLDDVDHRMSEETVAKLHPEYFNNPILRAAAVQILEEEVAAPAGAQPAPQPANLAQ